MADRPQDTIGGGGLILSLSIYQYVLRAVIWGRNDGGERGFWRISEEGSEGKIEADPPKGRYVLVCTSFFIETQQKIRGWQESLWRLAPRYPFEICPLAWRPCVICDCNRSKASVSQQLQAIRIGCSA
jgi:hypothetical protein